MYLYEPTGSVTFIRFIGKNVIEVHHILKIRVNTYIWKGIIFTNISNHGYIHTQARLKRTRKLEKKMCTHTAITDSLISDLITLIFFFRNEY